MQTISQGEKLISRLTMSYTIFTTEEPVDAFRKRGNIKWYLCTMAQGKGVLKVIDFNGEKYVRFQVVYGNSRICYYCEGVFENGHRYVHRHHIKPRCRGGDSRASNKVGLCNECARILGVHKKANMKKYSFSTEIDNGYQDLIKYQIDEVIRLVKRTD